MSYIKYRKENKKMLVKKEVLIEFNILILDDNIESRKKK